MDKGILWNGKNYIIPQAASRVDSSGLTPVNLGGAQKLAIMGYFFGLIQPGVATKINSPALAQHLIHPDAEEGRLAAQLVFAPSTSEGIGGASEVYLIPVNKSLQAAITDSSALVLTSYMYGQTANQIRRKIESGTTVGKKITIDYQGNVEVFDNLSKTSFTIQYTPSGTCTMSIDPVAGTLTTSCSTSANNLNLSFATFPNLKALTDAILATGNYTITGLSSSSNTDLCNTLDGVTAQDIKTTAYAVHSDLQAIINGVKSQYIQASRATGANSVPANDATWKYLTGGANGTVSGAVSTTDWQDAFNLLSTMPMNLICVLEGDASIHAMLSAHQIYMSGPSGKSERRGFGGPDLQDWSSEANRTTALTALATAAGNLNDDRFVNPGIGCYQYGPDGKSKLYPAYITAAMYAGMAAGSSPVEPLTNKYLSCQGLEVDLRISEVETLINAGIAPPVKDMQLGGGYVIARQTTTWQQSIDYYRIEFSVGRGADYISAQVRQRHQLLIGKPGTPMMDVTIINLTNAVLAAAKLDGYIFDYDPKKTTLRVVGDVRYIDYAAKPILPINYIFGTYHLEENVYTISL